MTEISNLTSSREDERPFVIITSLPMPPTSNKQYKPIRRGGALTFVGTDELRKYKNAMIGYAFSNRGKLACDKILIQTWLETGLALEARAVFFFHRSSLFTKKNSPKKLDVSNRLKAFHDELCRVLGIDDSLFFKISAEKAICHDNLEEGCCLEIVPTIV